MKLLICTQVVDKNHPILGFFHGWILEFAKYFDEVHVICLQKGEYEFPSHVHVHSLGKEEGESRVKYTYRFYKYFWQLYVRGHVDYVFFHMGAIYNIMAAPFFFVRKFKKTKFYWWKTHGHINLIGRVATLFVDRVYTAAKRSFPIETQKRHVVGHAIDLSLFQVSSNFKRESRVLFTGRIARSKCIEQVITIVKRLIERGVACEARIIGQVTEPKYYKELSMLVRELALENHVTFIEGVSQPKLVAEYQTAMVFINPSNTDGLDKVVLEAMACGCVPLTANLSFADILAPFNLYMQKDDVMGYAKKAEEIFRMSESERIKLGEKLHHIVQTHSLTTLPKRIFNIGSFHD